MVYGDVNSCSKSARQRSNYGDRLWCLCNSKGKLIMTRSQCESAGGGRSQVCRWANKLCQPKDDGMDKKRKKRQPPSLTSSPRKDAQQKIPSEGSVGCRRGGACYQLRLQLVPGCARHARYHVHGLWPQWLNGCSTDGTQTLERSEFKGINKKLYLRMLENWPTCKKGSTNENFWNHEWQKHGSCSRGLTRMEYFSTTLALAEKYRSLCSDFDKGKQTPVRLYRSKRKGGSVECGICLNKNMDTLVDCV